MSLAFAVQMNGLDLVVTVDVVSDGHDQLFDVPEYTAPESVLCWSR
jgi:hypothetical protein